MLGDNPETEELEVYWQKPAYDAVREAIENYFGPATPLKDSSGNDLVRFVRNGNVVVLKGGVNTGYSSWGNLNLTEGCFVLRNSGGAPKAAILPTGEVYLAGDVSEGQEDLSVPPGVHAMIAKDADGTVMSFIDEYGNLKMRGELIVKGIPYGLRSYSSDPYYPGQCLPPGLGLSYEHFERTAFFLRSSAPLRLCVKEIIQRRVAKSRRNAEERGKG